MPLLYRKRAYLLRAKHSRPFAGGTLVTWTKHALSIAPSGFIDDIDFFDGTFSAVASSYSESRFLQSSDGQTWNTVFTAPRALTALIVKKTGITRYVLLGGDADGVSYESSDLISWEETAHDQSLNGGVWNETIHSFVAVGQAALIRSRSCTPCTFSVNASPSSIAEGVEPITFEAQGTCGAEPYTYEWRDEDQTIRSMTSTLEVQPILTETTTFVVTVTDDDQSVQEKEVRVLVSPNPILVDPNGDGHNTMEDLFLVGSNWGTTTNMFDADGDGHMTVLDMEYVSVGASGNKPGTSPKPQWSIETLSESDTGRKVR